VARPRYPRSEGPLPPPLPHETRTVGQLVAESVRFYSTHFWRAVPLGLPLALDDQLFTGSSRTAAFAASSWTAAVAAAFAGAFLLTISYTAASVLVAPERPPLRALATALVAGFLAYLPFGILVFGGGLPGVAWLALVGLVVPVAVIERLGVVAAFRRAITLARADYIHALGSLATLAIVFFLTRIVLFFLLRGAGQAADRVAILLADVVIAPVVFVGAAQLYFDQRARVRSSKADGALPRGKPPASGPVRHPSSR
jgi:hypothetical protein